MPLVGAFWSITLYDDKGFPAANPRDRFAIGDRDALKYNPDGSLDVYICKANPGPDREWNRPPSPAGGGENLTMGLYAPKSEALDERWAPPAIRREGTTSIEAKTTAWTRIPASIARSKFDGARHCAQSAGAAATAMAIR